MDKMGRSFFCRRCIRGGLGGFGAVGVDGDNLFRLKDRKGADMCLGMTEEEVMTSIALKELRSYKSCLRFGIRLRRSFATSRGRRRGCFECGSS